MKMINSVHLDGIVESCRIVGETIGKTAAKVCVITLHPREQSFGSGTPVSVSEYEKIRHNVRVVASGRYADLLRSLEKEIRTEKASGKVDLMSLHPCSVDGVILEQDGENFVEARDGGFLLTEKVKTKGNDVAKVVGKVAAVSFTDESARVAVETPHGKIYSFFLKQVNRAGWDAVAGGKLAKGDVLLLQGPVMNMAFTDGHKTLRTSMLVPHVIQKQRLRKTQTTGVAM